MVRKARLDIDILKVLYKSIIFLGTLLLKSHVIPPPYLQVNSSSLDQCLAVDLCICFHQAMDEGSMMTIRAVTNPITGKGQFRQLSTMLAVLAGVNLLDSYEFP